MVEDRKRTIVIVGGVAGGASAATRARRCNEDARIIIFEKDAHVSFANCGLPYYLGGEIEQRDDLLVATPRHFAERFNIEIHTHHEVRALDSAQRHVEVCNLQTGATLQQSYDRLILATGAVPIVPPMQGVDAPNVFTIRNLEDTDRLKACLQEQQPRRAVVVGAGFIGLEMVEQLARLHLDVQLVELQQQVLPPLDADMAHIIQDALQRHGVGLHLGDGLAGLRVENGRANGVELSSGAILDADVVILGIGVRPNTALAKQAGIALGAAGGIQVDEFMRTSAAGVYAVGDAVEYEHAVLEQPARVALGGPANRAGRIAGQHAATDSAPSMAAVAGTAIVRVFETCAALTGLGVQFAHRIGRQAASVIIAGKHHAGYYPGAEEMILKLVYDPETARVLGAQAVGGHGVDKRIDIVATAMAFGATVYDLAGLDLAYAPPFGSAKDPLHMAAFAACNHLDGLARFIAPDAVLDGRQIVDVRTAAEVEHLPLAQATPLPVDHLRARLTELDPARSTVTVCRSGQRAYVAARILSQHGFGDVEIMSGGMLMRQHAT